MTKMQRFVKQQVTFAEKAPCWQVPSDLDSGIVDLDKLMALPVALPCRLPFNWLPYAYAMGLAVAIIVCLLR
jgi:hypothetical protein